MIAGDAVQKACEDVPRRARVKIAGKDGSSGATATFMRWDSGGMWGESNGHVIKARTGTGDVISQVLGGAMSAVA
jgi:hypothetical protein